jgi:hypothetical protein
MSSQSLCKKSNDKYLGTDGVIINTVSRSGLQGRRAALTMTQPRCIPVTMHGDG